jgi:hypothetical protein
MKTRIIFLFVLTISLALPLAGQVRSADTDKINNIQRLLTMMGADKLRDALMDQLVDGIKKSLPTIGQDEKSSKMSARLMELLREEFKKTDFASITVDMYDKYFTSDEIKALIQFYSSPVGQKTIQMLPAITQESARRGMELGQAAGERAFARWVDEFPELKKLLPAGK